MMNVPELPSPLVIQREIDRRRREIVELSEVLRLAELQDVRRAIEGERVRPVEPRSEDS